MTINELLVKLNQYPGDYEVRLAEDGFAFGDVVEVYTTTYSNNNKYIIIDSE